MTRNIALLLAGLGIATQAPAAVLFSDAFQSNLSQWNAGSGVIVAAPGGGNALAFTQTKGGGDAFAATPISGAIGGSYTISFDYLGTCAQRLQCGGFLGFDNAAGETWLAGSGPYPSTSPILETGAWQTITVNFSSTSPFTLKIEDWNGGTDGGTPGNAYFRNLVVSGAVPEASTWMMMIAGFGMIGFASRRKMTAIA